MPVTKLPESEARNSAPRAISSGRAMRFKAWSPFTKSLGARIRSRAVGHVHRCVGAARQKRIDSHTVRTEFTCQRFRQPDQAGLGSRISAHAGKAHGVTNKTRGEDHGPTTARHHGWDLIVGGEIGACQIDVERLPPRIESEFTDRHEITNDARIVEGDVETAEHPRGPFDQAPGHRFVANVPSHCDRRLRTNLGDDLGESGRVAPTEHESCALCGEKLCRRVADPELAPVIIATLLSSTPIVSPRFVRAVSTRSVGRRKVRRHSESRSRIAFAAVVVKASRTPRLLPLRFQTALGLGAGWAPGEREQRRGFLCA